MTIPLIIRKAVGYVSRILRPSFGSCQRCGMSWGFIAAQTICRSCWYDLTPEERLSFHQQLINERVSSALANGDIDEAERLLGAGWESLKEDILRSG